jgi:hypothetical protein
MAREPINIFSAQGNAEQVRNLLLTWFPDAEVETEGEDWTAITMEFAKGAKLTILHHRDYYAGPNWSRQKAGMQGYFSRFPLGEREKQLMATIGSFQFSLATRFEPEYEPPMTNAWGPSVSWRKFWTAFCSPPRACAILGDGFWSLQTEKWMKRPNGLEPVCW